MNASPWGGLPRTGKLEQLVVAVKCLEPVFDALDDIVFFLKDAEARYLFVNKTLMDRCMFRSKESFYGKLAQDIFPQRFGIAYTSQDHAVLGLGGEITNQLELHFYSGRRSGWCLTSKYCIVNGGQTVALIGISRDLKAPEQDHPAYERVAAVAEHIQNNYAKSLELHSLASMAKMSVAQLERYFKVIFNLSPRQLLLKARLDAARRLLPGNSNLAEIAAHCGYADHSAFSRQFKILVGISPRSYRASLKSTGEGAGISSVSI